MAAKELKTTRRTFAFKPSTYKKAEELKEILFSNNLNHLMEVLIEERYKEVKKE